MLRPRTIIFLQKRFKNKKDHWANLRKKVYNKDRALQNFDDFYGSVFGSRWKNIRVALLTEHKYVALVNNFGDINKTINRLELEGAFNLKSLIDIAKNRQESQKSNIFEKNNAHELDNKLEQFVEKQKSEEISNIYPNKENFTPEKLNFKTKPLEENTISPIEDIVDYKKPLAEVIEQHSELDLQRIVHPETGGAELYEFMPSTCIKGMEDWIPESDHYKYYTENADFPIQIELEKEFKFPENLLVFTFEKGNCTQFYSPKKCLTGVFSHFLLDGASILPPIFLDIEAGDKVLDACASPGGKSLLMLQTLYPDILISNDIMESRTNRIKNIMNQYLIDYESNWHGKRNFITQSDARNLSEYNTYDKILVDVPCTTDRHSCMENDNNIFKTTRVKERLRIPELQAGILANCLRLLKPGGSLVYSTCTLSPIQNDGVVQMALKSVFEEYGITAIVKDLSSSIQLFSNIFRFENPKSLKYGQMVLPYLPNNFGPMYFSKILRSK